MIVKAAPIIHARTKDIDFRANLLVVPDDFSATDVKWARKYIVDSTRYFELTNNYGRHIVFCNEKVIVVGVSIRIEDLYELCGCETSEYALVDLQRTNYAFVGFVLKKDTLKGAVDIPYTAFLEQYEKYMNLRWNDSLGVPGSMENTKASFQNFNFNDATFDENIARYMSGTTNYVVDSTLASSSAFVIHAIYAGLRKSKFAFCSNIPTANWVLESNFDVITSENAKSINETIKNKSKYLWVYLWIYESGIVVLCKSKL